MSQKEQGGQELLTHLEKMPPGQIYLAAHKKHTLSGFSLCPHVTVKDVCWSDDGSLLNVDNKSDRYYEVGISLDGENLRFTCDCKNWTRQSQCPHVVCVLASLKKAVSPESLNYLHFSAKYLDEIRALLGLLRKQRQPAPAKPCLDRPASLKSRFCLVLEKKEHSLRMAVTRDGIPVSTFTPGLPFPLRIFLQRLPGYRLNSRLFEEFFQVCGKSSPVVFMDGLRSIPVVMDRHKRQTFLVRLDFTGAAVSISRTLTDGRPLDENAHVMGHYLFNLDERKAYGIEANTAWHFWTGMEEFAEFSPESGEISIQRGSGAIRIDPAFFNRMQFLIPESEKEVFLECLRFHVDGKEVRPADSPPRYRLHARASGFDAEKIEIRAEGYCDEIHFALSPEFYRIFTAQGLEGASPPLRTRKRSAVLYDVCFEAAGCGSGKELAKIMRGGLNNGDFIKRAVRQEFKRIVEAFAHEVQRKKSQLLVRNDGWTVAPIDGEVQSKLLEIPWKMFGPGIFSAATKPGEMHVPKKEFLRLLPALHKRLEEYGFGLFCDDKPVIPLRWDFSLDATRSTLDWFEIRPEIRCDGAMVDDEEFAMALKNGGFIDNGSSMRFLDEESGRVLAMFAEVRRKQKGDAVLIPRLQILDWLMLRKQGMEIRLSPEDERIMESLFSFEKIPPRPLPAGLKTELRHYQREGYAWLGFLYEHRFGACLADDMGLGKTIQAISLLAGLKEGRISARHGIESPHLVVVPPSILFNWENEFSRFYPGMKVTLYRGKERSTDFSGYDVVLTSFDIVRRDIEKLKEIFFHVMIFDEAQSVKNIKSDTTSAVRRLKGDFRLALTGTPVENHPGEYCSIMDLAVPGLLGDSAASLRKKGMENEGEIAMIVRKTKPFVLRRSKQMIAGELPAKVETDIYLDLTPRQKALYTRTVAEVRKTVDDAYRDRTPGQARIIALTAILKLRQICLTTRLLLPEARENSPKIDFLIEHLRELMNEGHSVLVFSQFTSFLDIVEEEMASHRIKFCRLDGSTPVAERKKLVTDFQAGDQPSAFLLSLKAGGRGLNLTRASYVFHLDPWWNPAVENQASDRAHRIGQTSKVNIIRLLMRHTVEEKMMALKEKKLRLYKALLEDAETGGMSVSKEDFYFLLDG
jgi:superfamily II DNA or RNA helicase